MASSSPSSSNLLLLLLVSLLAALPILSSARPCKTLLISYSFTSDSDDSVDPTTTVRFFSVYRVVPVLTATQPHPHPHPAATLAEWSSLVGRTRDILVVVAGLVFGVCCGAVTAATMYLAWSIATNQFHLRDDATDEDDDGYVKMVEGPLIAVPSKEGYEGK